MSSAKNKKKELYGKPLNTEYAYNTPAIGFQLKSLQIEVLLKY